MPGGDPAMLEQLAARLETAAQGAGNLADSTSQVTADVRSAAEWTGDAADGYTAFTRNLASGRERDRGALSPDRRRGPGVRWFAAGRAAEGHRVRRGGPDRSGRREQPRVAGVGGTGRAGRGDGGRGAASRRGPGRRHGTGGQQGAGGPVRAGRCGAGLDRAGGNAVGLCRREMRSSAVIWPPRLAAARTWNWPRSSPRTCRS